MKAAVSGEVQPPSLPLDYAAPRTPDVDWGAWAHWMPADASAAFAGASVPEQGGWEGRGAQAFPPGAQSSSS